LVRFLKTNNPSEDHKGVPDDIIATQMNAGSQEYVSWVKKQVKFVDPENPPESIDTQVGDDEEITEEDNNEEKK
jgi:hypothetical protein